MSRLNNKRGAKRLLKYVLCLIAMSALAGCVSGFQTVSPQPPEKYEVLGAATGTGCGTLIGGPTAYNVIPVMLNSRVERAYQEALASVPGSTALINVTMKEEWFWWAIGSTRCVRITGEAIR